VVEQLAGFDEKSTLTANAYSRFWPGRLLPGCHHSVVAVGRHRSGDKSDVYEHARKLLRQRLLR
jgi:hypothetical protein